MAGVSLGLFVGYVVAHPLRAWKSSLLQALIIATPCFVASFALVWIAVYPSLDRRASGLMVIAGVMAVSVGMGIRLYRKLMRLRRDAKMLFGLVDANALIAIGVALTTGSPLIAMIAVSVSLAYWTMCRASDMHRPFPVREPDEPFQSTPVSYQDALGEITVAALLTLSILSIQQVKGRLPPLF
jgi:hypothetical protein